MAVRKFLQLNTGSVTLKQGEGLVLVTLLMREEEGKSKNSHRIQLVSNSRPSVTAISLDEMYPKLNSLRKG
jgi:hypothetical protein